jgi:tRNA threonylcarbamoyladenosine biosynthesis protein TsaB
VLALIDARRGEVFAAAWQAGECVLEPLAIAPEELAAQLGTPPLDAPFAVGDGAVRFREELERAGAVVPADGAPAHRVSALQICRLGAGSEPADRDALLPDYRREPDAKPPRLP